MATVLENYYNLRSEVDQRIAQGGAPSDAIWSFHVRQQWHFRNPQRFLFCQQKLAQFILQLRQFRNMIHM